MIDNIQDTVFDLYSVLHIYVVTVVTLKPSC